MQMCLAIIATTSADRYWDPKREMAVQREEGLHHIGMHTFCSFQGSMHQIFGGCAFYLTKERTQSMAKQD
eukprot:1140422-Pelagomonas_calceolata.AAC.4